MKRFKLLYTVLLVVAAALSGLLIACNGKHEPPTEEVRPELGVYYYDTDEGEYLITLDKGMVATLLTPITSEVGVYAESDGSYTLTFENAAYTAMLNGDTLAVDMGGTQGVWNYTKRILYTVTFDAGAGASAVAPVRVMNGKTLSSKPADPTNGDNMFIGWYTDANYTKPFVFGSDPVKSDMTLYARWVKPAFGRSEVDIAFDLAYEGAPELESKRTVGGKLYDIPTPTRADYTFEGWWVKVYDAQSDSRLYSYMLTDDTEFAVSTTLYALWQSDAATSKLASPIVNVTATEIRWNSNANARAYKVLVTAPDGSEVLRDDNCGTTNKVIDFAALDEGNYIISIVAVASSGNADNNSEPAVRCYANKTLSPVSMFTFVEPSTLIFNAVEGAERYILDIKCGDTNHKHTGIDIGSSTSYNFVNCMMKDEGIEFTVTAVATGRAPSVSETVHYMRPLAAVTGLTYDAENETLYWNKVDNAAGYKVELSCGNEEHSHNIETDVGAKTRMSVKSLAACDGKITVKVTPYTRGYNSPAATELQISKTTLAAPTELRIIGNELSWTGDEAATGYTVYIAGQTVTVDAESLDLTTITGITWENARDYEIRVRAHDSANESKTSLWSDTVDARYYALYSSLGYDAGTVSWRRVIGAVKYNVRVNDGAAVEITDGSNSFEVTLTRAGTNTIYVNFVDADNKASSWAQIEVNAEEVQFDLRGGEAEDGAPAQYYALGDRVRIPSGDGLSKRGYHFAGWYTTPYGADGLGAKYTDDRFANVGGLVLYASWTPETYDITFENGILPDEFPAEQSTATYKKPFTWPVPTNNDTSLVFAGWYSDPDGLEVRYTDENGKSVANWSISNDMTVYACWNSIFSFELLKNGTYRIGKNDKYWTSHAPANLTIPDRYTAPGDRERKVTEIGSASFTNSNMLVTVNIPDSIKYVDSNAFNNSNNILEYKVYHVDGTTLSEYLAIDGVLYYDKIDDFGNVQSRELRIFPRAKTGDFVIPAGVTVLPANALSSAKVTSITVPASVVRVEANAIKSCSSLVSIIFADGGEVTENGSVQPLTIEKKAFYSLGKLETVKIPARLANFEPGIFDTCNSVKNIEVEKGSQKYGAVDVVSEDGSKAGTLLTDASKTTVIYCPIKAVVGAFKVPAGITTIGANAFASNARITELQLTFSTTEIKEYAFNKCTALKKVSFIKDAADPFDLKIGAHAFDGCTALAAFDITNGKITEIGDYAFAGCNKLTVFDLPASPNASGEYTLAVMGEYVFNKCTELATVNIPAATGKLGNYAFAGCSKLKNVNFDDPAEGVEPALALGDYAFNGCIAIETVRLPAYINEIGEAVFGGCSKLAKIEVDSENQYFETYSGVLFTKGYTRMLFYPPNRAGEFEFPEQVTELSDQLFKGNTSLTAIVIGKNVEKIGNEAFMNCTALKSVIFRNEGKITLGESVFEGCTSLETVTLNDHIKALPNRAFYNDQQIKSLTLPKYLTSIGDSALYNLLAITELEIPVTVKFIGYGAFYNCKSLADLTFAPIPDEADRVEGVEYPANLTFGKDSNGRYAETFAYCAFTNITLPQNITEITDGLFYNCQLLENITISKNITAIGAKAFYSCSALTDVYFEEDATALTIRETPDASVTASSTTGVFAYCSVLENINLGARKIDYIPQYMFYNCRGLKSFVIPATVKNTYNNKGEITTFAVAKSAFELCAGLVTVTFDAANDNPVSIGERAFYGCAKMTTVNLPRGLAKIPEFNADGNDISGYYNVFAQDAFTNCSSFVTINVAERADAPAPVAEGDTPGEEGDPTGGNASKAYYYSYDGILCVYDEIVTAVEGTEAENTSVIREMVMCPTNRTKAVVIPYNITNINDHAFTKAFNIISLTFEKTPEGVEEVDLKINDAVKAKDAADHTYGAFNWFIGITKLELPARLTYIGDYAFYDVSMVHTLTIEEGSRLEHVGDYAFKDCGAIRAIEVPATVKSIGVSAFDGCDSISLFTFAENSQLKSIGARAFAETAFRDIVIPDTVTTLGANLFYGGSVRNVTLPASLQNFDFATLSGCADLTTVNLSGNSEIAIVDSVIYSADMTTLILYPVNKANEEFEIPEGVTAIAENAFKDNRNLMTVTVPNSVATIGEGAFNNCSALKTVNFVQDNVVPSVEGVVVAARLAVGDTSDTVGVFQDCANLKTVNLPARISRLGLNAFMNCTSLSELTFHKDTSMLQAINAGVFSNAGGGKLTLPESVKNINEGAFTGSKFTEIEMTGVTTIAKNAFKASGITRVVVPASVENIGEAAFAECENLEYAEIKLNTNTALVIAGPDSGKNTDSTGSGKNFKLVGLAGLFNNCHNLKKAVISTNGVIPYHMFYKCTSLEELEIHGKGSIQGAICYSGEKDLFVHDNGNNPDTITAHNGGLASLKKVTVANTITKIGDYAFDGCINLGKHTDSCTDPDCKGDEDHGFIISEEGTNAMNELGKYAFCLTAIESFVVPDSVTVFGTYLFLDNTSLKSITIPTKSFNTISTYAFSHCSSLSEVKFVDKGKENERKLVTIGGRAFRNCTSLKSIDLTGFTAINDYAFAGSGLTSVVIPDTVTNAKTASAAYHVFEGCASLESVTIPTNASVFICNYNFNNCTNLRTVVFTGDGSKLTSIGENAFAGCTKLTEITLPAGLTTINGNAFLNSGLKTVEIPPSVVIISPTAFAGCNITITVADASNAYMTSADKKLLLSKDGKTIVKYMGTDSAYTVPNGVETIGANAFAGNTTLESITFCEGLKAIESNAFKDCTSLNAVIFPSALTTIGDEAFSGCSSLDGVTFPSALTTLGKAVFMNCTSLSSISIPTNVTTMGSGVFAGCSALESVTFASSSDKLVITDGTSTSLTSTSRGMFADCILLETVDISTRPIYTSATATAVSVPGYMFYGCTSLSNVRLHEDTDAIGSYVFRDCSLLSRIVMPDALKTINSYAFSQSGITSLTLPEGLVTIGTYAFMDCSELLSINIPGTVKTINSAAFAGCEALNSITFEEDDGVTGLGFATGSVSLTFNPSGTITSRGVFGGCISLQSIDLSGRCAIYSHATNTTSTYKNIVSKYLFADCVNLKSVTLPAGIVKIQTAAFYNSGLTSFTLDPATTTIENGAFMNCNSLETFDVPKSSTKLYLGSSQGTGAPTLFSYFGAFQNCTSLREMELANRAHVYHGSSGANKQIPAYLFAGCTSLQRVTLPDEMETINGGAFLNCTSLKTFDFPSNLKYIYANAFRGSGITSVDLSNNNFDTIGESAFRECVALRSVMLPTTLKYMLKYVFMDCTGLKSLYIPAGIEYIGNAAFAGCSGLESLTFEESASPHYFCNGSGTEDEERGIFADCTSLTTLDLTPIVVKRMNFTKYTSTNTSRTLSWSYTVNSAMPDYMFRGCTSLQSVKLSDVMWFGGGYSNDRTHDDKVFADCTSLKDITFPTGCDFRLGDSSFENCGFETLTLPSNLAGMGGNTFAGNKNLVKLTVESNEICDNIRGFSGCNKLAEVVLPDTLKGISLRAFKNCSALSIINLPDSLEYIDSNAFENTALESVVIPAHVRLYSAVFKDCKKLKTVTFAGTSDNLGWRIFENCTALTSVTLPADLTYIPKYMFYGCSALTAIEIPATVTEIGDYAFAGCTSIAQIVIPAGVTDMGEFVFEGWTATQTIYIETLSEAPETWSEYWNYNSKQVDVTPAPEPPAEGEDPVDPDPVFKTRPDGPISANIVWSYTRPVTPAPDLEP